ncbi:MAG: hypothetical protein RDU30_03135 [Desulfovibrionaceae bacterium]|nr:hypothetical protein [Desulfovibrionaceae bacterium]
MMCPHPEEIKTGYPKLDRDIEYVYGYADIVSLTNAVASVVNSKSVNDRDVLKVIPPEILRFVWVMLNGELDKIKHKTSEVTKQYIQEAEEKVHPICDLLRSCQDRLGRIIKQAATSEDDFLDNVFRMISRVQWRPVWMFEGDNIKPAARILLKNRNQSSILLDTTASWDNILYLAYAFTDILAKDSERSVDSFKKQIDPGRFSCDADKARERIERIKENLQVFSNKLEAILKDE